MEVLIIGQSADSGSSYLATTMKYYDQLPTDGKTMNCLLIDTYMHVTYIGNFQRFLKHIPFEAVDESKTEHYLDIIKTHFSESDFDEKIVSKLMELDESDTTQDNYIV